MLDTVLGIELRKIRQACRTSGIPVTDLAEALAYELEIQRRGAIDAGKIERFDRATTRGRQQAEDAWTAGRV